MALKKLLRLPRLNLMDRIVTPEGTPTAEFLRFINGTISNVEAYYNALSKAQEEIALSLEQAGIAMTTAEEVATKAALQNSYTDPGLILSAAVSTVDPSKAKISVASHSRRYGDGTSVPVTGGVIENLSFATNYYVFYDQASRTGGSVAYMVATDYLLSAQTNNRHAVGSITTPNAPVVNEPPPEPTYGGGPRPPGTGPYQNNEKIP